MEYLLVKLLVDVKTCILQLYLLVREEHEVVDKDLGCLFESILWVYGTVRSDFEYELVVVGLLLDTCRLYRELHVADRGVNRIDGYCSDISAELTVLISWYVTTSLVDGDGYLH